MMKSMLLAATCMILPLTPAVVLADGIVDVATIGEPPTLDPMASTADVVGMTTQHIFETLFTYDDQWNVVPLLAEAMPEISEDGTVYDIKLRDNVPFHDGTIMDSSDVVAAIERWMDIASRGKQAAPYIKDVTATGDDSVRIVLNEPYAPLMSLLAFNNSAAVIMPKENLEEPLTKFIGTGPYMLKEHRPDQYIQLVRFDDYAARSEPSNGFSGKREAVLDEIPFCPGFRP